MKKIIQLIILLTFHQTSLLNAQTFKDLSKTEKITFLQKNNLYSSLSKQKNLQNNSKTIKQVLDSVIQGEYTSNAIPFESKSKVTFNYDFNERLSLYEVYRKPFSGPQVWEYGGDGNDQPKREMIYNGNYDFTQISYDNQLNLSYKYEYFHNTNNLLTLIKFYFYDTDLSTWSLTSDVQITYSGAYEDYRVYRYYDETQALWINVEKYDKNFTSSKQINTIVSEWDMDQNVWNNYRKYEFTYNTANKVNMVQIFKWVSANWQILDQQTYTYDANNRIILLSVSLDQNTAEYHLEYDNQNNITLFKAYFPGIQTTSWERYYYYNLAINTDETVIPPVNNEVDGFYFPFFPGYNAPIPGDNIYINLLAYTNPNKLDSLIHYEYWMSTLYYEGRGYFYYSQRDLGLNSPAENKPNIYPNPTTNFINIEESSKFESFELIDIKGELILKDKLNSSQIDVSSLQNGIYLLNLFTDDKLIVRNKIIKE